MFLRYKKKTGQGRKILTPSGGYSPDIHRMRPGGYPPEGFMIFRWISGGYPPNLDAHWPETGGDPVDIRQISGGCPSEGFMIFRPGGFLGIETESS